MGGLRHKMPTTFWVYMVGTFALSGIFPLAGFWSKDEILAHASSNGQTAVSIMLTLAAICTAFYMGRQIKMVFFGKPRHAAAEHAHESPKLMTRPLIILAGLAILGGGMNLPFFSSHAAEVAEETHNFGSSLALEHWLEHSIMSFELTEEHVLHMPHTPINLQYSVAIMSTIFAVLALAGAFYVVYGKRPQTADERDPLQSTPIWWFSILPFNTLYMNGFIPLFNRVADWLGHTLDWVIWHDFVHNNIIRDTFVGFAKFTSDVLDADGVDGLVNGAGTAARRLADFIRTSQTGYARNYALGVFLGTVVLLAYFLFFTGY